MNMSNYVELYKMIDRIVNEGDKIKDFGIHNKTGELWAVLESGKIFEFLPNI